MSEVLAVCQPRAVISSRSRAVWRMARSTWAANPSHPATASDTNSRSPDEPAGPLDRGHIRIQPHVIGRHEARGHVERGRQYVGPAGDEQPAPHCHRQPLMRVQRNGIRGLDPRQHSAPNVGHQHRATPRRIHVEPQPGRPRDGAAFRQRVDHARPRCPLLLPPPARVCTQLPGPARSCPPTPPRPSGPRRRSRSRVRRTARCPPGGRS